jgi:hypothetical protein
LLHSLDQLQQTRLGDESCLFSVAFLSFDVFKGLEWGEKRDVCE